MKYHSGSIVEKAVRQSGMSISELSRRLKVDRKSIYNWFQLANLNKEIVAQIGYTIKHDFSKDFPEYPIDKLLNDYKNSISSTDLSLAHWMNKYFELLEKYNKLLTHNHHHTDLA